MSFLQKKRKHFLDISQLDVETIRGLLLKAIFFAKNPPLIKKYEDHKFLFYFKEPSTRTSLSFQLAAKSLGIEVLTLNDQQSSFVKGEDFQDGLDVFKAMGFDGLVMRLSDQRLFLGANQEDFCLINAGSGVEHHPSQAILDMVTIYQHFNRYQGLKIAIIGDTDHSRVANSHKKLHQILGNELRLYSDRQGHVDWNEIQEFADVVMMLRIQKERHVAQESYQDYRQRFGLNKQRLEKLKSEAIVLHPGPFNRDVEISSEILKHNQVKILDQVYWGVPTRMAIFDYVLGGL